MIRQATTYQIAPSAEISRKYSANEILAIYKNTASAKGVKFLAFNESTKKFSVDSMYIPKITEILISTGIQANFVNTFDYDDVKANPLPPVISQSPVNYNPANYTEYPVKTGEYAFMISKKLANSPTRWTEIIRKNTSSFLNSSSATQLKAGEILLIPKSWNASPGQDPSPNVLPPSPIDDPTKKKSQDDDDLLFFGGLGYVIWKFIF